jgi:hypothetical protein
MKAFVGVLTLCLLALSTGIVIGFLSNYRDKTPIKYEVDFKFYPMIPEPMPRRSNPSIMPMPGNDDRPF